MTGDTSDDSERTTHDLTQSSEASATWRQRAASMVTEIRHPNRHSPLLQSVTVGMLVLLAGLLFLVATPPGAAPDEDSHYVRVGGLANGSLFGTVPAAPDGDVEPETPQDARVRKEAGIYTISPEFNYIDVVGGACNAFDPVMPACNAPVDPTFDAGAQESRSNHARTQPLPYVVPTIASKLGWTGRMTFFLTRLGMTIQCAAVIAAGWWAFATASRQRRDTYAVLGPLLVGLTPLAVSLVGVISPSALETCSALALVLATWGLVRAPRSSLRAVFIAILACSVLSRSVGIAFGVLAVLCGTWAAGATLRQFVRALRPVGLAITGVIALVGVLWDPLFKANVAPTVGLLDGGALVADLNNTWVATTTAATNLGWLDVAMPLPVRTGIQVLGLWVLFASFFLGTRRWGRRLLLLVLAYFAIGAAVSRGLQGTGFGMQARFILPGWAAIIAGCTLHLSGVGVAALRRVHASVLVALWVSISAVGAYTLLRRHEVGALGPIWFPGEEATEFRPLGGYGLFVAILVGFLALGAFIAWSIFRAQQCDDGTATDEFSPDTDDRALSPLA